MMTTEIVVFTGSKVLDLVSLSLRKLSIYERWRYTMWAVHIHIA